MQACSLTRKELWKAQQAWRTVFARRLYRKTGRWVRGGADRYVFHPDYVSTYLTGAEAEAEYSSVRADSVFVVDEGTGRGEVYDCRNGNMPSLSQYMEETGVVIFPESYEWTIVTGPDYFDPVCFTYREWVDEDDGVEGEPRREEL